MAPSLYAIMVTIGREAELLNNLLKSLEENESLTGGKEELAQCIFIVDYIWTVVNNARSETAEIVPAATDSVRVATDHSHT